MKTPQLTSLNKHVLILHKYKTNTHMYLQCMNGATYFSFIDKMQYMNKYMYNTQIHTCLYITNKMLHLLLRYTDILGV